MTTLLSDTIELRSLPGEDADLTIQRAATLLGVSLSYFKKLLEDGGIQYSTTGNQQSVSMDALRRYIAEYQAEALPALAEMTADAQRMKLYE